MSLWIKRDTQLARNHKTFALADLLAQGAGDLFQQRDRTAWRAIAIALLEDLWSHLVEHHPDGDITDVHPEALLEPVRAWLVGTEWLQKDVRELLLKSGHLERIKKGRIVPHDWFEWTGADAVRLANDRKRKRLERHNSKRTRPQKARRAARTRPGKVRGQSPENRVLEEKRREEKSREDSSTTKALRGGASAAFVELRTNLPPEYHGALEGYLRGARDPEALVYAVRALGPGGIHEKYSWAIIGRGLFELAADRDPSFSPKRLDIFCRNLMHPDPEPPSGLRRTDAERMADLADQEERRTGTNAPV